MTKPTGTNVTALHADAALDRKILKQRLGGLSIRELAQKHKIRDRAVVESLDRSLPSLAPETRARLLREDLARLDSMMLYWYAQAQTGNAVATSLVIKLMERKAHLTGLDAAPTVRLELVQQQADPPNSTMLLLEQLDRIAAERLVDGQTIDGECTPVDPNQGSPDLGSTS